MLSEELVREPLALMLTKANPFPVGLAVIGVSIFLLLRRRRKKTRGQQPLEGGTASDNRSSTATPAMSVAESTSPTFQNELGVDKNNKEGRQNSSVAEAQELPGRP